MRLIDADELIKQIEADAEHIETTLAKMFLYANISDIKHAPTIAQPEIIRCRECKYAEVADKEDSQDGYTCQFHRGSIWFSGSYCSWAERREDEQE